MTENYRETDVMAESDTNLDDTAIQAVVDGMMDRYREGIAAEHMAREIDNDTPRMGHRPRSRRVRILRRTESESLQAMDQ